LIFISKICFSCAAIVDLLIALYVFHLIVVVRAVMDRKSYYCWYESILSFYMIE